MPISAGLREDIAVYRGFIGQQYLSIAPKKRHNSDWHYPIDFWTEKDGSEAKQNTIIEKAIG